MQNITKNTKKLAFTLASILGVSSITLGQNLIQNPSGEDALVGGEIPSWTEVGGTTWSYRQDSPLDPHHGNNFFFAGTDATTELRQDVDVSGFSIEIDNSNASFVYSSYVSDFISQDDSQVIVEYRDAANTTVLASFDSGQLSPGQVWTEVTDTRTAPVGTRTIRIRLLSNRDNGTNNDGYHDDLSLTTTATADVALAVELDSFQARQIENKIQLKWSTASEKNNEGFNVYRKVGNGNFSQIASYKGNSALLGALNSSTSNYYSFIDNSELRNNEFYTYYVSDVETNGVETEHTEQAQTVKFTLNEEVVQNKIDYVLEQNFPNPFNPSTKINFQISKDRNVKLEVFNLKGELVKELVNENLSKGSHSTNWDGTDSFGNQVSSGTYFYKISAGTFTQTNRMVLLK